MAKAHRLELLEQGFWRRAVVQSATLAALRTRPALAVRLKEIQILKGKAAIVPRSEVPRLIEPEEQTGMMVPAAELTMLGRHMTEPEHDIAVAEVEHQTALAEVPEMSRLEPWDMSELECKITVAEVPEVTRLERTMLSKDATVLELEAVVAEVQLRANVP